MFLRKRTFVKSGYPSLWGLEGCVIRVGCKAALVTAVEEKKGGGVGQGVGVEVYKEGGY